MGRLILAMAVAGACAGLAIWFEWVWWKVVLLYAVTGTTTLCYTMGGGGDQ